MSELKPCPFCGGKQTYRKHDGGVWLTTTNHKRGCIMREALSFVAFDTEAEAIAAWNTRAERTCRIAEYADAPIPVCSECGAVQPDDFTVYYCWNCGARVLRNTLKYSETDAGVVDR